jgi:hypothetical protein
MFEKHGFEAIAQAAQNAVACESRARPMKPESGVISRTP